MDRKKDLYVGIADQYKKHFTEAAKDPKRDEFIRSRIAKWEGLRFLPRREQYESGVQVVIDPGENVMTNNGPQWMKQPVYRNIGWGPGRKGVTASSEVEAVMLLAFCYDQKVDVCLYDDREMSKAVKLESKDKLEAVKRAEKAEAELEDLKKQIASSGISTGSKGKSTGK